MLNLWIDREISAEMLHWLFAVRRYDPTFEAHFSNLTPYSVEECVHRVQDGHWLPFLVKDGPDIVAWHVLHDMRAVDGITLVGGYVMRDNRGGRDALAIHYKRAMWETAQRHILYTMGYRRIFAYVMAANRSGQHWATACCLLTEVGTLGDAVPEDDGRAAIVVYCHEPKDAARCRNYVKGTLFPEGRWTG